MEIKLDFRQERQRFAVASPILYRVWQALWCIVLQYCCTRGVMKAVTLRSLPPNVAEAIRKEANRKGISLNKAVISLLENRVGAREKKIRQTRHHDLDDLAGSWSKQEAAAFDKSLADQPPIEPALCK
jgi:hypothetical protein